MGGATGAFPGIRWDGPTQARCTMADGTNYKSRDSSAGSVVSGVPVNIVMTGIVGDIPDVYINSVLDNSSSITVGGAVGSYTNNIMIANGNKGKAKIDVEYVLVYNRSLSAFEIALLYREPFCMFEYKAPKFYIPAAAPAAVHQRHIGFKFIEGSERLRGLRLRA